MSESGGGKMLGVPCRVEDISPSWVSTVLNLRIEPSTFRLVPVGNERTGFLSAMARVQFDVENAPQFPDNTAHIIVKLLPDPDFLIPGALEMVRSENLDKTEIRTYTDFFPDVVEEVPELQNYFCPFYYASIQELDSAKNQAYGSVLILKDLKPEGYSIVPFSSGYESALFAKGLHFTASLHVGSRALERKRGQSLDKVYPWLSKWFLPAAEQEAGYVPQIYSYFPEGFGAVFEVLGKHSRTPDSFIPAYKSLEARAAEIYQLVLEAGQAFPCGIHGDLWSPNILVHPEKGQDMKVIDWQFFGYSDPAFDLSIYIMAILPLDLLDPANISKAVRSYYSIYVGLCEVNGLEVQRGVAEFEAFFNTYGIAYYLYVIISSAVLLSGIEGGIPKLVRLLELSVQMGVISFLLSLL